MWFRNLVTYVAAAILFMMMLVLGAIAGSELYDWMFPDSGSQSDPTVYERYVEDMRRVGRNPDGSPISEPEPDAFTDSIYWNQ